MVERTLAPHTRKALPLYWMVTIASVVAAALFAFLRTEWQVVVVTLATAVLCLAMVRWTRRPKTWLYAMLLYYPIHPTAYRLFILVSPSIPSPVFSVWQDISIIALFVAGLCLSQGQLTRRLTVLDLVVAGWLFTSIPSAVVSGDAVLVVYGFRLTYLPVLLYFAVRFLPLGSIGGYRALVEHILTISSVIAALGFLLYFVVPADIVSSWYAQNNFVETYYQGIRRMDSIFWTPVVFGSLMALSATLSFAQVFSSEKQALSLGRYYLAVVLCSLGCLMSLSRGAWIAEVIGVGLIAFLNRKRKLGLWTFCGLLISGGALAVLAMSGSDIPLVRHAATIFSDTELGTGQIARSAQRASGLLDISKNFLWGDGLGKTGYVAAWFESTRQTSDAVVADNWYIKLWQESGLLGFSFFMIFVVVSILYGYRGFSELPYGSDRAIVLGIWAAFIGFSCEAYGSNVWDFFMVSSVCWVLLAAAANIIQNSPGIRDSILGP